MEFQTPSYTIDQLVSWIDTGRLALPEFQREFVWPPSKVTDLLDSVARGWPVGSLLMLEGPQPFQPKPIDGGPKLGGEVRYYVLDGQQRITALYHAVADISDILYFVDFAALAEGTSSDAIGWVRRKKAEKEMPSAKDRAARYQAKISEIFDQQKFHLWQAHLPSERAAEATGLRERFLSGIRSKVYKLPAIQLVQEIKLEALARIFETVNRSGVRLNAFDLMVAVLYPQKFNLRDEWEAALATNSVLERYGVDGLEILKLAALRERRAQQGQKQALTVTGIRQGDVLKVPPARIRADWDRCLANYVAALDWMKEHYGVFEPGLVPSDAMVLTLAFALDQEVQSAKIHRWYWTSIAEQSYAQGANTRVVSDADRLVSDQLDWKAPIDTDTLRATLAESIKRNQILLRGLAGLLVSRGATDPLQGTPLASSTSVDFLGLAELASGKNKLDVNAPLKDVVLLSPSSARTLVTQIRSGRKPLEALKPEAMLLQGFDTSPVVGNDWTQYRPNTLAGWFEDTMRAT